MNSLPQVVPALVALLFLSGWTLPVSAGLAGTKPNIVLVITDDQGYGDVGRHGNPAIHTPNLDRLHDESVRFTDFRVSPTCAPTRCSLMTGRHEFLSGITHTILERERMSLDAHTLPETLRGAGYATGIFGKWHLGDEDAYQPGRRGFDEVFIHGAGGIGQSYAGSCGDAPGNRYFNPVIRHNGRFVETRGYCTDVFFEQAMRWIAERPRGKPFYCHIATNAPHAPLVARPEDARRYAQAFPKPAKGPQKKGKAQAKEGERGEPDEQEEFSDVAKFFGMVSNIDDNLGRLLAKLKELDLERDTLVIFMNDNGGTVGASVFNAGMAGAKGTAHNGGTRAISFWRWPGRIQPASVGALTAHVDVFPTLAQLAGVRAPEEVAKSFDGHSLVPLLEDPAAAWPDDRVLVTHVGRWKPGNPPEKLGSSSVRSGRFLYFPGTGKLFDVRADPGEKNDLAKSEPATVKRLSEAYDAWWERVRPALVNEEAFRGAPAMNSFHRAYWEQYKGPGPNRVPPPAGFVAPVN